MFLFPYMSFFHLFVFCQKNAQTLYHVESFVSHRSSKAWCQKAGVSCKRGVFFLHNDFTT